MRLSNFFVCSFVLGLVALLTSACGAGPSSGSQSRNADGIYDAKTPSEQFGTVGGVGFWHNEWSDQLRSLIQQDQFIQRSMPQDFAHYACPRYFSLNEEMQREAIIHFFYAIAKAETELDPYSRFLESSMGIDPVTHQRVYSEGLLQLSYQDGSTYRCDFDWNQDRQRGATDHGKTIFDSQRQFACGVHILHAQIAHLNRVFPAHAHYWEVLRPSSRRFFVIKKAMREFAPCY
jgi:hypothetical protein